MLTAKSQIQDKVEGLDSGADDYLTKPFSFEELLARIRALTRRPKNVTMVTLTVNDLALDSKRYSVKRGDKEIQLSNKEFSLLEYLMKNAGVTLTKEQIIMHVWDYDADILPNTVEAYVKKLRAKKFLILTIRGFGYRLGEQNV